MLDLMQLKNIIFFFYLHMIISARTMIKHFSRFHWFHTRYESKWSCFLFGIRNPGERYKLQKLFKLNFWKNVTLLQSIIFVASPNLLYKHIKEFWRSGKCPYTSFSKWLTHFFFFSWILSCSNLSWYLLRTDFLCPSNINL